MGPASISNGRMAYNEVINYTEDQQILNAIVRERYGQTFGMLAVSSVTANIKFGASVGAELRAWGTSAAADDLTPLSLGTAYEENPTISYTPMQSESIHRRLVMPITIEEGFLLLAAAKDRRIVDRLLYKRVNRLELPIDRPLSPQARRAQSITRELREAGILRFGRTSRSDEKHPEYFVALSGYSDQHMAAIREFLELLGIEGKTVDGQRIAIPFGFFTGAESPDSISVESRSVLDWLRIAGSMIDIPESHLEAGIVESGGWLGLPENRLIRIRTSLRRPSNAVVAVPFRGWWYYIDAADSRSKDSFRLIKFLFRLRINPESVPQQVPVLTIPVG